VPPVGPPPKAPDYAPITALPEAPPPPPPVVTNGNGIKPRVPRPVPLPTVAPSPYEDPPLRITPAYAPDEAVVVPADDVAGIGRAVLDALERSTAKQVVIGIEGGADG
jgi:hypothetical protein